jgi:hypothetical protein
LLLLIAIVGVDGSILVDGGVDVSHAPVASRAVGALQERLWACFVLSMVSPDHRIINPVY